MKFFFQHPIVILKDVAFEDLQVVVKFMYYGIVNVSADKLPGVLKVSIPVSNRMTVCVYDS